MYSVRRRVGVYRVRGSNLLSEFELALFKETRKNDSVFFFF